MAFENLVLALNGWGGVIIIALAGIFAIWWATKGFTKEDRRELFKAALDCKFKIGLVLIIGIIMMLSISWLIT